MKNRKLKRRIREHAAATGKSYAAARLDVVKTPDQRLPCGCELIGGKLKRRQECARH